MFACSEAHTQPGFVPRQVIHRPFRMETTQLSRRIPATKALSHGRNPHSQDVHRIHSSAHERASILRFLPATADHRGSASEQISRPSKSGVWLNIDLLFYATRLRLLSIRKYCRQFGGLLLREYRREPSEALRNPHPSEQRTAGRSTLTQCHSPL